MGSHWTTTKLPSHVDYLHSTTVSCSKGHGPEIDYHDMHFLAIVNHSRKILYVKISSCLQVLSS
jgi:hypothetical protein